MIAVPGATANSRHSERTDGGNPSDRPLRAPRVSLIMGTYNRGELLSDAVRSVLAQDDPATPPFELIVVDNNSTDGTRRIVGAAAAEDSRVRYLSEHRQGLSYARNAGIHHARAPLIAFVDDDVRVANDFVAAIARAFADYPNADIIGGRVLPIWPTTPPAWLTRDHWAPLALADYGDAPVAVSGRHPICLVGANLACRRSLFDFVGTFAIDLQRVKSGIGSLEDHEFLLRVLRSGRNGMYDPRIVVHAAVQPDRLEPAYHRRWHAGHGHFHALLRSEHIEQTRIGTFVGVPAHLYRQALGDLGGWLRAKVAGDSVRAFSYEMRLRFFSGFYRTRRREFLAQPVRRRLAELRQLARIRMRRRGPLTHPVVGARE